MPVSDRKGVDMGRRGDREELGGVEVGDSIFILHCMKENLWLIKVGGKSLDS